VQLIIFINFSILVVSGSILFNKALLLFGIDNELITALLYSPLFATIFLILKKYIQVLTVMKVFTLTLFSAFIAITTYLIV
jgi:hypothetical protein